MDESAAARRKIGVSLLDDHEILRWGVKDLLEAEPDIVVIGEGALFAKLEMERRTQAAAFAARIFDGQDKVRG
jgi:two-component system response regulator DevR